MKRRQFIALVGSAAGFTSPLTARAQQQKMPMIGFLDSGSPDGMAEYLAAFHRGLGENGYVEGRNVTIEYRWARGQADRLPALAAELIRRKVAVIAATRSPAPALAAKAATSAIPIVFQTGSDPVKDGLVASMNRPGGNVTGVTRQSTVLSPKRLELLSELVPDAKLIAVLFRSGNPVADSQVKELQEAARSRGLQLFVLGTTASDLDATFTTFSQKSADALIVINDPVFIDQRERLVTLTASHAIPTIYAESAPVFAGGLMSYAASLTDSFRQVGAYVGQILKGAKPADLPVQQPTTFELVINLKTAKALGLTVPPTMLALADEVIE